MRAFRTRSLNEECWFSHPCILKTTVFDLCGPLMDIETLVWPSVYVSLFSTNQWLVKETVGVTWQWYCCGNSDVLSVLYLWILQNWGWSNLQYQLLQRHDNPQLSLHFRGCNQMVVCLFPFLLSSIAAIYVAHLMSRAWHYSLASLQAPKEDVWQETPPYLWEIPSLNGSVTLEKKHGSNLLVTWTNWWFPGESIEFLFDLATDYKYCGIHNSAMGLFPM